MVTLAPPSLTPREAEILDAYFTARGDLAALAERLKLSAADLLAWSAAPAVAAALEALDVFNDQAQRFRLAHRRLAAIDALARVCRESESLVEQRLAATALLRGPSTPRAPRAPRPDSPRPDGPRDRSFTPSRAERGASPHRHRAAPQPPESRRPRAADSAPRPRPATPHVPATSQSLALQSAATQSPATMSPQLPDAAMPSLAMQDGLAPAPPLPLSFSSSLLDLPDLGPRSCPASPPHSAAALIARAGRADTG